MDANTPGGVYLCQVSDSVSCGACCGLYNLADTSKDHVTALLVRRTAVFGSVERTAEAIDAFASLVRKSEAQQRPFKAFHHCPFIGMIGDPPQRVGCLLHPLGLGNRDVDYRGLSYYGGLACRTYFCPTCHELSADYKRILRGVVQDWHLYGLIVTEKKLLQALFAHIEKRIKIKLTPWLIQDNPSAARCLLDLIALKTDWPYRSAQFNSACHYFFADNPSPRPPIDYQRLGCAPSVYDSILEELTSEFETIAHLRQAEQLIDAKLSAIVHALGS